MTVGDRPARFNEALLGHGLLYGFIAAQMLASCDHPQPSLPVSIADAGANSPPAIISMSAEGVDLPPYTEVVFETGANAGTLDLTLYDTDVGDALYVRVFVNYNVPVPTPPRSTARDTIGDSVMRTVSVSMTGVCTATEIGADPPPLLQVYVFDRQVLDNEEPIYQAMPSGGLSTSQTLFLHCIAGM